MLTLHTRIVLTIVLAIACVALAKEKKQLEERHWGYPPVWGNIHSCKMAGSLSAVRGILGDPLNIAKLSCRAVVNLEKSIYKIEALISYLQNGKCSIYAPNADPMGAFRAATLLS